MLCSAGVLDLKNAQEWVVTTKLGSSDKRPGTQTPVVTRDCRMYAGEMMMSCFVLTAAFYGIFSVNKWSFSIFLTLQGDICAAKLFFGAFEGRHLENCCGLDSVFLAAVDCNLCLFWLCWTAESLVEILSASDTLSLTSDVQQRSICILFSSPVKEQVLATLQLPLPACGYCFWSSVSQGLQNICQSCKPQQHCALCRVGFHGIWLQHGRLRRATWRPPGQQQCCHQACESCQG